MRIKQAERIIIEAIRNTINRPDGKLPICPYGIDLNGYLVMLRDKLR